MFSYICFVVLAMSIHTQNIDALFCALEWFLTENKGIRAAAREYSVQKSTLQRHVQTVHLKCADVRATFYTCKHCDSNLGDENDL